MLAWPLVRLDRFVLSFVPAIAAMVKLLPAAGANLQFTPAIQALGPHTAPLGMVGGVAVVQHANGVLRGHAAGARVVER